MLNECVAKGDYFELFSKKIPQFSIQHLEFSITQFDMRRKMFRPTDMKGELL